MSTLSKIIETLETAGCEFPDIGLLQPADPFLDTTGEDLRRRIFITQENSGKTLCLRPEFTVPVCLSHLESCTEEGRYAYGGKVFRQRGGEAAEFTQAGFESLGNPDLQAADIDCIKIAVSCLQLSGHGDVSLTLGDQAIFESLLDALGIPDAWKKKLMRGFGDEAVLAQHLDSMSSGDDEVLKALPEGIGNAVKNGDRENLVRLLGDTFVNDGLPLSGGRTPSAIADRMMEKAELAASKLPREKRLALEAFLQIDVALKSAVDAIASFEKDHGLVLPTAKENLSSRVEGLAELLPEMRYRASFGRRLDYYTGLVFELYKPGFKKPLVGGGRYDRLLTLLGAKSEIPAVGFAIWVDRLEGVAS